jgi:hypothetical protein
VVGRDVCFKWVVDPANPRLTRRRMGVDGRDKPGHDTRTD